MSTGGRSARVGDCNATHLKGATIALSGWYITGITGVAPVS